MPGYMVMQIGKCKLTYEQCIKARPQYKDEIERLMREEGLQDLIA